MRVSRKGDAKTASQRSEEGAKTKLTETEGERRSRGDFVPFSLATTPAARAMRHNPMRGEERRAKSEERRAKSEEKREVVREDRKEELEEKRRVSHQ